jgi:rod shape-determining protein MreB
MYFSLPISATEVEKRAYRDSCEHAGGKEIFMIHQPITSAISMKLLFEKKDFVLMDISASKVSVTVFSNSEQIATGTIRMGTWKLQNALRNYIFRKHNLKISTSESENILENLSNLGDVYEIKHTSISTKELKEILVPYFAIIEDQIQETLELASSNQSINKILSNGFFITGGGSKINYIIEKISILEKVKYKKSSTPLLDNIIGLKEVMKKPSLYESYLIR